MAWLHGDYQWINGSELTTALALTLALGIELRRLLHNRTDLICN